VREANKGDLQRMHSLFTSAKPKENVPTRYRLLYKYATTMMKETGASIQIACDTEVFGFGRMIFILHENIVALLDKDMIGQSVIAAYMT
jgi:hypothetical protein